MHPGRGLDPLIETRGATGPPCREPPLGWRRHDLRSIAAGANPVLSLTKQGEVTLSRNSCGNHLRGMLTQILSATAGICHRKMMYLNSDSAPVSSTRLAAQRGAYGQD